jgi:lipopolysaccharide transport system ATP-binding protein
MTRLFLDSSGLEKATMWHGDIRFLRHAGKTLLCVSHSLETLCDRALWLDHGRVFRVGPAREVIKAYQDSGAPLARAQGGK